jgi:hypothetical protein
MSMRETVRPPQPRWKAFGDRRTFARAALHWLVDETGP